MSNKSAYYEGALIQFAVANFALVLRQPFFCLFAQGGYVLHEILRSDAVISFTSTIIMGEAKKCEVFVVGCNNNSCA